MSGDADVNGAVDVLDYVALKRNYGSQGDAWAAGDFDLDGDVDRADLLRLKSGMGPRIDLD